MKRIPMVLSLAVFFSAFSVIVCYPADRNETKTHASPEDIQKAQQASQQRPILSTVVPQPGPMVPMPSPHIASPQIQNQVMSQPSPASHIPQPSGMQNMPSVPTHAVPPSVPGFIEGPNIPTIGNAIGKVAEIGSEKDGSYFLDVNDDVFGEIIKVKIRNLRSVPVVKQIVMYDFNKIKIGDTVNAMYHTENEENIVDFISVLTEEEIEMRNQMPDQGLTVTTNDPEELQEPAAQAQNSAQPEK
ncbi:MAG: hypothetical protein Q7O04_04845 [Candidatus Omnitrophota bacterium]|nr:hypothetical protein [Candidatus Omnitrophota bacterium]